MRWSKRAADASLLAADLAGCHPFDDSDPFLLATAPDLYIVGNQPHFATSVVTSASCGALSLTLPQTADHPPSACPPPADDAGEPTRVVLLPRFAETGTLVLVHTATLAVRTVSFDVDGWGDEGGD